MSLQTDLLQQAKYLANREPKRPKQASLRRAVSTAYYAVFHLLIDESTRLLIGGNTRTQLRSCLKRAYAHAAMKDAARGFASGNVSPKLQPALNGQEIQPELRNIATAFVELQQARHEADYDAGRRFTRNEVIDLVELAEQAFTDWKVVKGSIQADTFW